MMTVEELIAVNDSAPTPFSVEAQGDRIRIRYGDDPLDFIDQTHAQAAELIEKLQEVVNRRVERGW